MVQSESRIKGFFRENVNAFFYLLESSMDEFLYQWIEHFLQHEKPTATRLFSLFYMVMLATPET